MSFSSGPSSIYRDLLTTRSLLLICPSFEMSNENNTLVHEPSNKVQNLEVTVERLTHLLSVVQIRYLQNQLTQKSTSSVPTFVPEIELMTEKKVKSRMKNFENQIKEMKKIIH